MIDEKLYKNLIQLLCERYDYHTYAADINETDLRHLLDDAIKVNPSLPVQERQASFKAALIDFFEALYQRVFVFEENDQLRLVKHYDADVLTEREDRYIHYFRQMLLDHCLGVKESLEDHFLYEFSSTFRHTCETALDSFDRAARRTIIRDQFRRLFDLNVKDMIAFLDKKIFIRRFEFPDKNLKKGEKQGYEFFVGDTFIESFWNDVAQALEESFKEGFVFYEYKVSFFKAKAGEHFLRIIDRVVSQSIDIRGDEKRSLTSVALQQFWPHFFEVCALELLDKIDQGHRKAILFMKLLLEEMGTPFEYNALHQELKRYSKILRQIDKKNLEYKQAIKRCHEIDERLKDSEEDVRQLDIKRRTLMDAIAKIEEELDRLEANKGTNRVEKDRLEISKRDILEVFKLTEAGRKKCVNIATNRRIELSTWLDRKRHKKEELTQLKQAMEPLSGPYENLCKSVALLLQNKQNDEA